VKRAGGLEQREFEAGRLVVAQSGCLACHRIGDNGNAGPGPNLTHVGSKLQEPEIAHALEDPRAPMPSFRHLPAQKFHEVVRFLALLR
jgi:ubiquinol-cytochrome c reductase cytochrome b subunit/menaquinol-cytochrome c reductase cytochrome b/c subunit